MMPNSSSLILFAGLSERKYVMKRLFVSISLLFFSTEAFSAQGTSSERELLDGALFVFAQATDPEVFLLIEARQSAKGSTWSYALARMNGVAFTVLHQKKKVWSVDELPWSNTTNREAAFTVFYRQ